MALAWFAKKGLSLDSKEVRLSDVDGYYGDDADDDDDDDGVDDGDNDDGVDYGYGDCADDYDDGAAT